MSKSSEIATLRARKRIDESGVLAEDTGRLLGVLEDMEQGILVWDDDEKCAFFSDRMIKILGIRKADISIGVLRNDFLAASVDRGELTNDDAKKTKRQFAGRTPFQFDRCLRSGRVVSTQARPYGESGYVVTFTDVSNDRRKAKELDETIRTADEARRQLAATLNLEKSRQYEAGILNDLGDWLQSCKSLEELYSVVRRYLGETLPGSQGELYIYSNSRDVLDGVLSWGGIQLQDHIHADACWGLRRGRRYQFGADEICFECAHVSETNDPAIEEYTCIPIVAHGDTVGLLHIRHFKSDTCEGHILDPSKFASKCGELVSLAIANVRLRDELHEQSTRDSLTGLRNRRFCIDTLAALKSSHRRDGAPFAIVSLDVDKFKDFNDTFGHDAGDAVLQSVANTMKEVAGSKQVPCRFGGEEFLIILPNTDTTEAAKFAEELRRSIMKTEVSYAGKPLPGVTVSCGVAIYPRTSESIQGLLKLADLALYRAKDNGRNCVEIAECD
ncbi:diguanylate cyclase [Litoreibacter sp.]|nr:diguanylate cyclase [Litoreibacter sp.]